MMEQTKLLLSDEGRLQDETGVDKAFELSVVVPSTERFDDLRELYVQYSTALAQTGRSFEFIFVLVGRERAPLEQLKALKREFPGVKVLTLNRTFGEATALSVGFDKATAPLIVTLSSYFQVEPSEIRRMLEKLDESGADLVISRRHPRIDSRFNRIQSAVFHRAVQMLTGTSYHDISCGLRVMKRKVAEEIKLYGDLHRFIPLLAYERGFRVVELDVRQSKHDVRPRLFKPGVYLRRMLDILTLFFLFKFTKKPLRFFGLVGSALSGLGLVITGYLGVYRLLGGSIGNRPLLILGVLLVVLGCQLFSIGLLGEIIIFTHARSVKNYEIEEIED